MSAVGRCPAAPLTLDQYEVTVESPEMLRVEVINCTIADLTTDPIYQETFTQRLSEILGARVTTVGWHQGVKTTCCSS